MELQSRSSPLTVKRPRSLLHPLKHGMVGQIELQRGQSDVALSQCGLVRVRAGIWAAVVGPEPVVGPPPRIDVADKALLVGGDVLREHLEPLWRAEFLSRNVHVEERARLRFRFEYFFDDLASRGGPGGEVHRLGLAVSL